MSTPPTLQYDYEYGTLYLLHTHAQIVLDKWLQNSTAIRPRYNKSTLLPTALRAK